ncbi:MAG: polysaccharide biosynthesis C-terminal domain-containing protein [Candidatus Sulfotelmatobacter sp.]
MNGLGVQEPAPLVKPASEEGALGRFPLRRILSIDCAGAVRKLVPWAMKGGLAILDQGLFAGSNFVISILLARWLTPEQYGSYAVAFSVFVFMLMFHQALLLEPMLVFGSSAYRNCLRGYLKALLLIHLVMSLAIVLVLGIAAGVAFKLGQTSLPGALVGVAFAAPSILMLWIIRRIFYVKLSPAPSAAASLLYCILTMAGLALLYRHDYLSPLSSFLLMGVGSLLTSAVLLTYLGLRLSSSQDAPSLLDIWRRHWHYGRWAIGANVMMWVPLNVFYPLLSSLSGLAAAGELKALMNFASPMYQTSAALSPLMLPHAARVLEKKSHHGVSIVLWQQTLLSVSYSVPYWIVLLLFRMPIFRMIYSGRYTQVVYLMPIIALACVFGSAFFGPANVLRVTESPRLVFAAVSISSCVAVAVGIPITWTWGVKGAAWSMALSEVLAFVVAVVLLRRQAGKLSEAPLTVTV